MSPTASPGGKFVTYVGSDDYARLATGTLLKAIGGKGNVVIIEGVKGSETSNDRVADSRRRSRNSPR